jgi:tRNA-uridine 2-sulfurtransferase
MKVAVGISGGVDSAVTASVLIKEGHDVTGVFLRTWHPEWLTCDWQEDRRDAMRVCAHLNIPFVELDCEEAYKNDVVDYLVSEYASGRTPNPDVLCNRSIKFGVFWDWAKIHGYDAIATGHYARTDGVQLLKGIDPGKDQSYFLWKLTTEDLAHVLFPLGGMPKTETRELAKKLDLPVASKRDSQGICFLGDVDLAEFLAHFVELVPGDVADTDGNVIGHHPGALSFTLGERRGFTITEKSPQDEPYYVVAKDVNKNTLTVAHHPELTATRDTVELTDFIWRTIPDSGRSYDAQIRYHGTLKPVRLREEGGGWFAHFEAPDYTIASGQSVVVYDGDICIGGGIVK